MNQQWGALVQKVVAAVKQEHAIARPLCEVPAVSSISTGIPEFDLATGIGGLPCGRLTEVFGRESSGKTTLALRTVAQVQGHGGIAVYFDLDHSLDAAYARALGVNVNQLLVIHPEPHMDTISTAYGVLKAGCAGLIVIDTIAGLLDIDAQTQVSDGCSESIQNSR